MYPVQKILYEHTYNDSKQVVRSGAAGRFCWALFLHSYIGGRHRTDSNQFNLSGIPGGGDSLHLMHVFCGRADCFEPFGCTVHLD